MRVPLDRFRPECDSISKLSPNNIKVMEIFLETQPEIYSGEISINFISQNRTISKYHIFKTSIHLLRADSKTEKADDLKFLFAKGASIGNNFCFSFDFPQTLHSLLFSLLFPHQFNLGIFC